MNYIHAADSRGITIVDVRRLQCAEQRKCSWLWTRLTGERACVRMYFDYAPSVFDQRYKVLHFRVEQVSKDFMHELQACMEKRVGMA
jgi:hypothetical protein